MNKLNLDYFQNLDNIDPLAKYRDEFHLPKNIIYFDGNSLGLLPKRTIKNLEKTIYKEWGEELIRSWNNANWINMPLSLGDKIAPLLGANPGEVIVVCTFFDQTLNHLFLHHWSPEDGAGRRSSGTLARVVELCWFGNVTCENLSGCCDPSGDHK